MMLQQDEINKMSFKISDISKRPKKVNVISKTKTPQPTLFSKKKSNSRGGTFKTYSVKTYRVFQFSPKLRL